MAWSTPRTWSTGDTLTAALMNDNSAQLTALHTGASGIASLTTGDVVTASSSSQLTRQATLNVSQGGTGAATHTTGNTLVGAGTGAITSVATLGVNKGGTGAATHSSGNYLKGAGTGAITSASASATFADVSPLTTRGDILYSPDGTLTGARLAVGGAGEALLSDGTDVAWGAAGGGFSEFVLAYNESAISCANEAMVPILCDAEKLDSDSMHDNVSNQARITFTTAGTYFIYMNVLTSTANADWALYLLESDGPAPWLYREIRHITDSKAQNMQVSAILTRSAASYISMNVWQNSGSAQDVAPWTGAGSYSMPQTYMLAFRIA